MLTFYFSIVSQDELKKKKEEGTLITEGSNDILTMALGTPEQSGRVRGASMYYTPTTYFNLPRRGSRKHTEKLEAENQTLKVAVIELLKQAASSGSSPLNETIIELLRQQGMDTPRLSEHVASNSAKSAKSDNREHVIMTSEAHRSCGKQVAIFYSIFSVPNFIHSLRTLFCH